MKLPISRRVFVLAVNIHQGGGRSLLDAVLDAIPLEEAFVLLLDERMSTSKNLTNGVQIKRIGPSIMQRLNAERWLARSVAPGDVVLCLGSLPPLFKLLGHTVVFVQNRHLIDVVRLNGLQFGARLRLAVLRCWLSNRMLNANEFVVQTPTMKQLLETITHGCVPVCIRPFVAHPNGYTRNLVRPKLQNEKRFDFVYVASGEPHKNHRRLMDAWYLLAKEELFPSLCLTLNETRFSDLCEEIETMCKRYGLKVKNVGELSHQDMLVHYKFAGAAIYPSTCESLGLPLIEARQAGLPVLASELDYVRDVLDPEQSFDPESAVSIARAVKRFMGLNEQPLPLSNATSFIESTLRLRE